MFFTGLRSAFLKSTGFRSAGYITHDDAKGISTMNWLEASYNSDIKAWQIKDAARISSDTGGLSEIFYKSAHSALTFKDAVKTLQDFEQQKRDPKNTSTWPFDRNLHDAESILKDQKYSLRHKIMNIGLPKL